MTAIVRLHASAEDLSKDYLTPSHLDRVTTPMSTLGIQEISSEELQYDVLINLLEEIENGVIRKPDHFNNLHFLLLLLYDSHGYPRDRYPLWRWYHRIKKKLLTTKHFIIDTDNARQHIFHAVEYLIDTNSSISTKLEEGVHVEEQYLHSPVHGIFKLYTPLHTYLYMEQIDKAVVNENSKIFQLFQSTIIKIYRNESCDLIHYSIAHRKTALMNKIFDEHVNWLDMSMNLTTERGWLPIHYASYVGDKDLVKTICDTLTSPMLSIHFDPMSLLIPHSKRRQFDVNPNDYILKTCGIEHNTRKKKERRSSSSQIHSFLIDTHHNTLSDRYSQQKFRANIDARDQPPVSLGTLNSNSTININNDNDIPDADELELSSLPLIQRDEFIDKVLHMYDKKQMLIPSPLILACLATCGERKDYDDVVKILLDSHLLEFDGLNHECILNHTLDYMHRKDYASFQQVQVYRDTEIEGPSALIFYQFDGFIINQDVKPLSGSSATLNTSKNEESGGSDEEYSSETPINVRCFLTVLVLRDIFLQYPRWDFHLLRENIEEHFIELENALGCRPTILYPDGDVISSRKRSDVTWEVIVKYRLSSETGQTLFMQVDYYFFESFGDALADTAVNVYQTPFYVSCMTESTVMMDTIFESFFKRRNLHCWGTIAQKHLEHCFDGVLQTKNNCSTFLSLCATLNHYYQLDGDPFLEENSIVIQRIFVHAFACCARRNAKIELNYLIKNHALIYYDSCRTKPGDIRHNILTYCVVRNLAVVFDQLMINMKTSMYKTYQNSTNPDWQPHIAWREIIHVIIDPVLQQQNNSNEQTDFIQLACYGDSNTSFSSIGSMPILHSTGEEYVRCANTRKNIILKAKRKLPRTLSDTNKNRPISRRVNSFDQQQIKDAIRYSSGVGKDDAGEIYNLETNRTGRAASASLTKKSRNIFKNVNRLRWRGKNVRHSSIETRTRRQQRNSKQISADTATSGFDESSMPGEAVSLPDVNDPESDDDSDSLEVFHPTTPILPKRRGLQSRQTIDTDEPEQYLSHRTPLQHIQAMLRPIRVRMKTSVDNEHEQMPMNNEKRSRNTSDYEHQIQRHEDSSERRRRHRRSDTVAIV